jgi:outer membrane biosynthesis protein TonB
MQFKTASIISTVLHGSALLFALLTFSGTSLEATQPQAMPVDLVSVEDFSKVTKGVKDAPKPNIDMPKPMAEKEAPPKPVEELKPKVDDKKPIEAAKADSSPPPPAESKPDEIADKIKKEEPKQEAKAEPQKMPPPKPQAKPQPKFDADKIAALLDKRAPTREAATGAERNAPALGASGGSDKSLSQSELDAMRSRLRQCWNPPVGATNSDRLYVVFRVLFKRDGTLSRDPDLIEGAPSQFGPALVESAKRALLQCQPYSMLRPDHYDLWKDIEIKFDPREMFGG